MHKDCKTILKAFALDEVTGNSWLCNIENFRHTANDLKSTLKNYKNE